MSALSRNYWDTVASPGVQISAGTTSSARSDFTFSNANGISFGIDLVGVITASGGAGGGGSINISAGTTSTNATAFTFSNSNNVSFGINGQTITASIATTYAGTGFTTATTAGTAIVGTLNTSGLSMGVPAYLTTAALSQDSSKYAGTGFTTATTAGTNVVGTLATNGLSMGVPAYLTTAALSGDTSKFAGTGFTTATTAGTAIVGTLATNGLSMGVPAYLTTAMQSNAATISNIKISAGTLSQTRSDVTFADSGGVSWGLNTNGVVTASIATTYAGTGFTTATTAGTAIVGTLNTSGLSMGVPAFLTTAALSSQTLAFTLGGNSATTNSSQILNGGYILAGGANITIQQSNNTISISGGAGSAAGGVALSNSQTLFSTGTVNLLEGGGAITIASSAGGQSFKFSVPQTSSIVGTNGISVSTNGSTISVMPQWNSYWANLDRFIDGNSTTLQPTVSVLQVVPFVMPYAISGSWLRVPVIVGFTSTESAGTTVNTTWTLNRTYSTAVGIYSQLAGASSMSLGMITSTVGSWVIQYVIGAGAQGSRYTQTQNITYQVSGTTSQYTTSSAQSSANIGFSTNQLTLFTSARFNDIPFAVSLSPGNYWAAFGISTNTASTGGLSNFGTGASMGMSFVGLSHSNLSWGAMGIAPNNSIQLMPGLGSYSTNAAILSTTSIGIASVSSVSSHPLAYFQIMRFA